MMNNRDLIVNQTQNGSSNLTEREIQCLSWLANGLTAKEIAKKMNISHRTVETHVHNIKIKLNCSTRLKIISKIYGSNSNYIN